jgi:hypothetical protein
MRLLESARHHRFVIIRRTGHTAPDDHILDLISWQVGVSAMIVKRVWASVLIIDSGQQGWKTSIGLTVACQWDTVDVNGCGKLDMVVKCDRCRVERLERSLIVSSQSLEISFSALADRG